jgi:hypothetical protein
MSENIITRASKEWKSRPDDQRFLSLEELAAKVGTRKRESWTARPLTDRLQVVPGPDNTLAIQVYDPSAGATRNLAPTNFAFGQLANYAQAPASYLKKLPSELAAINLQWGLERSPLREDALVLAQSNGEHKLRAMISVSYGRIWDSEVVSAVQKANADGRWRVPAASYATTNPKRATTLYASDRDVFIFLVDPKNPVTVGDETLFRGFYAWNSEVGSATFGLCTFLYRYVCDNRIIWGASNVQELRIRHTGGAPERFAYEGARYLERYAEESTAQIVAGIKKAQEMEVPVKRDQTVAKWLQGRGFLKSQAEAAVSAANAEEGGSRTVWEIVNGITAYARSLPNADDRVSLEVKAGRVMELVA